MALFYVVCLLIISLKIISKHLLRIFTADYLRHPIQMAGIETIWELHTLPVINS